MNNISLISDYAKENNVKFGVIVFVFLTFFSYTIIRLIYYFFRILEFLLGYFTFVDYQFLLGAIGGVIYTTKYRKEEQSITKINVIVVVIGGLISALCTTLVDAILYINTISVEYFFYYLLERTIYGLVIGVIVAMIIGARFMYKEFKEEQKKEKQEKEEDRYGDEFFEDLIDK